MRLSLGPYFDVHMQDMERLFNHKKNRLKFIGINIVIIIAITRAVNVIIAFFFFCQNSFIFVNFGYD